MTSAESLRAAKFGFGFGVGFGPFNDREDALETDSLGEFEDEPDTASFGEIRDSAKVSWDMSKPQQTPPAGLRSAGIKATSSAMDIVFAGSVATARLGDGSGGEPVELLDDGGAPPDEEAELKTVDASDGLRGGRGGGDLDVTLGRVFSHDPTGDTLEGRGGSGG
jgi:hypothetical protein